MAKQELKKPIDILITKKNEIDRKLIANRDKFNMLQEKLNNLRHEQFSCREAKETLGSSNQNKPAKRVFDKNIADLQVVIDETLKGLDACELERVVVTSEVKALEKSIKELQNA